MAHVLGGLINVVAVALLVPLLMLRWIVTALRKPVDSRVLCFFHPYCNDGGGGERVLWCLVRVAQAQFGGSMRYRVYHGDVHVDADTILAAVSSRFGIVLTQPVEFVLLRRRAWVESSRYPVLTLAGQALGSVVLGLDALLACPGCAAPFHFLPALTHCASHAGRPAWMIDTMGYAFAYPVFSLLGGCTVLSYTHYPMISTDMLNRVRERRPQYNNAATVAHSAALSTLKLAYYRSFAWFYARVITWSHLSLVNSSWTAAHIPAPPGAAVPVVVYPAVNTSALMDFPLAAAKREPLVVSVAQFRPEKDHALQLRAFAEFRNVWRQRHGMRTLPRLVLVGSVRNDADALLVAGLRELAAQLQLTDVVDFAINVTYAQLQSYLARARVGLHTMWNEHFGIGIVELMAAGVLVVAHDSGGPRMDIVVPAAGSGDPAHAVGYLATTAHQYAQAMLDAFAESDASTAMQSRARVSVQRFSEQAFDARVAPLLRATIHVQ